MLVPTAHQGDTKLQASDGLPNLEFGRRRFLLAIPLGRRTASWLHDRSGLWFQINHASICKYHKCKGMCITYIYIYIFFWALTNLFILPGVLTVLYRKMKRNATECGTETKADMYTVYMPVIYTYIFTLNLVSALGILEELIFPCLLPTESPGGWPLGVAKHQPRFRFRRPRAGGHACSRHLGSCLACEWSRWRRAPIKRPRENDIYVIMCIGSVYSNVQMN